MELQAILNTMADVFGNEDISLAIKDMVFNLKTTANNMNQIIEELSKISSSNRVSNILEETETLLSNLNQTLSKDDYEKIKRVIDNFEEFSNDLKEITNDDQLKTSLLSTLEETRSTFSQSNSFFNTLRNIELKTSAGLNHIYNSTSSGYLMYLVNIDFYLNASFLNFGISNFNKKDQLMTILVNSPLDQQWWFKYGINKESPGFGIMYRQKNIPLSGSMIFYNIDDVDIDMDISYNIYRRWSLAAGGFQINKPLRAIYIGASFK